MLSYLCMKSCPWGRPNAGRPVGYALYFFGYNVNHGRMLYLENLFVASDFRGTWR